MILGRKFRGRLRATVVLSAATLTGLAHAQQSEPGMAAGTARTAAEAGTRLELSIGASHSDNINRVPSPEEEGTIGQAGLLLNHSHESRRLRTNVNANVAYQHYLDGAFDDDVIGGADGALTVAVVPERFEWVVEDSFGQLATDPFAASTPENRENVNVFSTGPDFIQRFGAVTSLRLSGRYTSADYETSAIDSERHSGALSLVRALSSSSNLSLNATGEKVEYDDELDTSYEIYQGFVRYDVRSARTTLSADLGYTVLDDGSETSDGLLLNLSVSRQVSAASSLIFSIGTQFSDSGDLFRMTNLQSQNVVASSDPFESRFASIGWDFRHHHTSFGLAAQVRKEDYENVGSLDRTTTAYSAYLTRQLSRRMDFRMQVEFEEEDFDVLGFEDKELLANASLGWTLGRMTALRLQYDRFDRDSTDSSTGYTEDRVSLFITWSPLAQQR